MKTLRLGRFVAVVCVSLFAALGPPHAIAADDLVVGQVVPLSAPIYAAVALEYVAGAEVYFASINAKGGVSGRKIRAIVKDVHSRPTRPFRQRANCFRRTRSRCSGTSGHRRCRSC